MELCIYHFRRHTIYCSSICTKPLKTTFSVFLSFFKVEDLENGLADFNDFGLILQDFE